ncbi:MAG: FAD-dependent oxidoreductase [Alphaproteobacteria bacterium]|nr:FAD-dependent oxidoreductase [Alphaproteobacteria bacterium]
MTDCDVVVIGAGVAGLAAAATIRAAGRSCVLIEASGRIGGRALTTNPSGFGGAWFDHGATWLHAAERNPLVGIAEAAGETVIDTDKHRNWRLQIGERLATSAEAAAFEAFRDRFEAVVRPRARAEPDISFADAMATLRDDPWAATVELWEAAQIAAADPARFSLRDWDINDLDGGNRIVEGGIGAFIARRLGPAAGEVSLETRAERIDWSGPIRVETNRGTIRAATAIVTVSTGVLSSLPFAPALPASHQAALDGLPMGLLTKIAIPAISADRLGLPDNISLRRQAVPGVPMMSFTAWPFGRPYLQGFVGGPAAWELAREGQAATADFALAQVRALLGADAARSLGAPLVTGWAGDPNFLGSYAYATVGNAAARAALAVPLADGRLQVAGEAVCTDGLAGTLGGAYLSGTAAAHTALAALLPRPPGI